jgi:hypothetical protein
LDSLLVLLNSATGNGFVEFQRGSTLGSSGWAPNTDYEFEFIFTKSIVLVLGLKYYSQLFCSKINAKLPVARLV